MDHAEYVTHDALALAELVRTGEVAPAELVEAAIARMDEVNDTLNAVVHRMDDTARAVATGDLPEGPFRGVPFLVKDMDGYLADEPWRHAGRARAGLTDRPGGDVQDPDTCVRSVPRAVRVLQLEGGGAPRQRSPRTGRHGEANTVRAST